MSARCVAAGSVAAVLLALAFPGAAAAMLENHASAARSGCEPTEVLFRVRLSVNATVKGNLTDPIEGDQIEASLNVSHAATLRKSSRASFASYPCGADDGGMFSSAPFPGRLVGSSTDPDGGAQRCDASVPLHVEMGGDMRERSGRVRLPLKIELSHDARCSILRLPEAREVRKSVSLSRAALLNHRRVTFAVPVRTSARQRDGTRTTTTSFNFAASVTLIRVRRCAPPRHGRCRFPGG
jgi:hypothetical protein